MIKISSIRGMHDLVGQELSHHHDLINQFISVAQNLILDRSQLLSWSLVKSLKEH